MFARCVIHGASNSHRRSEWLFTQHNSCFLLTTTTSRCLKRRWNDRPWSCLDRSQASFSLPMAISTTSSSFLDLEHSCPRLRHCPRQQWRNYHASFPQLRPRPIHTTATLQSLSPAAVSSPLFEDEDNVDDNELIFSNTDNKQKRIHEDLWYNSKTLNADEAAAFPSSSSACQSLEDQLGLTNIWDMGSLVEESAEEDDDDDGEEEDDGSSSLKYGSDSGDRSSWVDNASWKSERKDYLPTKKYSGVDVMKNFHVTSPPPMDNLEDYQLWLECEAHLESAMKYQKVLSSARNRKDYGSLPMVQRQLVRWHDQLTASIEARQTDFVTKRRKFTYGPYLCALPAQKLAVVTAHEAVTFLLLHSGKNTQRGCLLSAIAQRIGDAVEEELDVQKVLRKRVQDARQKRPVSLQQGSSYGDNDDDDAKQEVRNTTQRLEDEENHEDGSTMVDVDSAQDDFDDMLETWMYGASHLRKFIEEFTGKSKGQAARRQSSFILKRARQLLERDGRWPIKEKIKVGVALLSSLIEEATVTINGVEQKAFTYDRRRVKGRHVGYVAICDEFFKMVTEDSYQQLNPYSTRLKPMVVPSRKWVAPNDGGYCWLKVDLMRFHGCEMQRVR